MDFEQYLPSIKAAILLACVMLNPTSCSLSKIRVMTLHVAARTNILLMTWQEDLAAPQPPEQPRMEGEGAPASTGGEVSGATAPQVLPLSGSLLSPWQDLPLPPVVLELPCKETITVSTFELLDKTLSSSVLVFATSLSWEFSMSDRWRDRKLLPDLG